MPTITITIPGPPMGKPRMTRRDKWAQRDCVVRFRNFADLVRLCVKQQVGQVPDADSVLSFCWVAYFTPPESLSYGRKAWMMGTRHRVKPDKDNVEKGLLDILYKGNDQKIADGSGSKRWAAVARTEITIEYEAKANVAVAALSLAA